MPHVGRRSAVSRHFQRGRESQRCRIPARRIVVHCARENGSNHVGIRADVASGERRNLLAGSRRTTPGQQLVCDRRQREDVGRRAPRRHQQYARARYTAAAPARESRAFQGFHDAEAAGAGLVGCDKDVAKMKAAVAQRLPSAQNRSRPQAG